SKWLRKRSSNRLANRSIQQRKRQACFRPWLEMLEDRALPSAVSFSPPIFPVFGGFTSTPSALVAGDFDGDGKPDLAASFEDLSRVSILLGNGNGTFQPDLSFRTGTGPSALATGDFDGDGKLDLAVYVDVANFIGIYLGNGDGTFRSAGYFYANGGGI